MKLWHLRPIRRTDVSDPWYRWYDKCFGFVVRAESEGEARAIADANSGCENDHMNPWLDDRYSECEELLGEGKSGMVIRDFRAA